MIFVVAKRIVHNFLTQEPDGRIVGFPLYRYLAFFSFMSGAFQLIADRAPESMAGIAPSWYTVSFVIVQMFGSAFVLISILAMENTPDAAQLERIGVVILSTVGVVQFLAVTAHYDQLPVAQTTWLGFAFSVFCFVRIFQITKELSINRQVLEEETDGEVV